LMSYDTSDTSRTTRSGVDGDLVLGTNESISFQLLVFKIQRIPSILYMIGVDIGIKILSTGINTGIKFYLLLGNSYGRYLLHPYLGTVG
jgi:hypothetical protein